MKEQKKEIRAFELMKGLYIHGGNYERFAQAFDKAYGSNKEFFIFRNHQGRPYQIRTEFVAWVIKLFSETNHGDLAQAANEYKKGEEKLTKEEFEKKKEQLKAQFLDAQRLREKRPKIYNKDSQVIDKPSYAELKREESMAKQAKSEVKKTPEPPKTKEKKKKNKKTPKKK